MKTGIGLLVLACLAAGAWAQTDAGPEFEVASVKPAPPPTGNGIRVMMRGGPGSEEPGRLDWNNVSLQNMLTYAFNIKEYQLQGPDWVGSQRFDMVAKLPPNTTREQARLMLQKLLADRFKLTVHHESREHGVYALVVAKGGPKLTESDPNDTSGLAPMMMPGREGGQMRVPAPPPPPGGGRGGPAGGPGRGPGRGGMMMSRPGHLQAKKIGIDGLANFLSNLAGKPVLDQTGLKGIYDFTLDYAVDSIDGGRMMMGGGEGRGEAHPAAASDPAPDLFSAVQQQLGLRMEQKKLPLDNIVVDHIEKVPTEN